MKEVKAKEVAQTLDKFSEIFMLFPDLEFHTALDVILHTLKDSRIQSSTPFESPVNREHSTASSTPPPSKSLPITIQMDELLKQLESTPTEKLEDVVRASVAWKNVKNLKELLRFMSITFKSVDKKDDLLQNLVSHFETRRMHALIRNN